MGSEGGLVLSSTSLSTWLDCHLQWFFRYVMYLDGEPSDAITIGIAVHEHAEAALKGQWASDSLSSDPEVLRLVTVWATDVAPLLGSPQLVEAPYRVVVNGITYQSTLDVVDAEGRVRDLKTTAKRPRSGRYRLAMIGHALGSRALTGNTETDVVLDYIVRTKSPYYWPESYGGPITEDDIDDFAAVLDAVATGIDREEYDATGLESPWACAMCPYRAVCGPRLRYEGIVDG